MPAHQKKAAATILFSVLAIALSPALAPSASAFTLIELEVTKVAIDTQSLEEEAAALAAAGAKKKKCTKKFSGNTCTIYRPNGTVWGNFGPVTKEQCEAKRRECTQAQNNAAAL